MSKPSSTPGEAIAAAADSYPPVTWAEPERHAAFDAWLARVAPAQALAAATLRPASADASFRRYLRIDRLDGGTRIVMDAPPAKEDSRPFVRVAGLMREAGLNVPEILDWDAEHGFMLLSDVGTRQMIEALHPDDPLAARPLFARALDALLAWQQASRPGVLPAYDQALLERELQLFPDWYLARHRGLTLSAAQQQTLAEQFALIVRHNLAAPSVYVHRDFMPRNLMLPPDASEPRLAVLDFQDAVYGPITYDIASLMRDAFLSWDEEVVLDITIRYWERARKAGLIDFEGWSDDFSAFWRAVEWMGLQRHLKVAGIFARLTLRDGKPRYLADAPRFIGYIRHTARRYNALAPLARLMDEVEGADAGLVTGFAFGRI